jgi:hypothetical protein
VVTFTLYGSRQVTACGGGTKDQTRASTFCPISRDDCGLTNTALHRLLSATNGLVAALVIHAGENHFGYEHQVLSLNVAACGSAESGSCRSSVVLRPHTVPTGWRFAASG